MNAVASRPMPVVRVDESSQVGEARRAAASLARALGFGEEDCGRVALVATEAATNLVKHGGGGRVLFARGAHSLDVLAVDSGRGIADPAAALRDGMSTAGTPGTGLGAMRRVADQFDLYTRADGGTVVLASLRPRGAPPPRATTVRAISVPLEGEHVCGDAWAVATAGPRLRLLVVDGLGHGEIAATAADAGVQAFLAGPGASPAESLADLHGAMRATRGGAAAVAELDPGRGRLLYAGVGNIAAVVWDGPEARHLVSMNGTLGQGAVRVRSFEYEWRPGALLIAASDGLATRWRLDAYPGLASRHPAVIAAVLWRDHARGRDDVTVLVARGGAAA